MLEKVVVAQVPKNVAISKLPKAVLHFDLRCFKIAQIVKFLPKLIHLAVIFREMLKSLLLIVIRQMLTPSSQPSTSLPPSSLLLMLLLSSPTSSTSCRRRSWRWQRGRWRSWWRWRSKKSKTWNEKRITSKKRLIFNFRKTSDII